MPYRQPLDYRQHSPAGIVVIPATLPPAWPLELPVNRWLFPGQWPAVEYQPADSGVRGEAHDRA